MFTSKLLANIGLMRYLNNTTWMLGEQTLRLFSGLFIGALMARFLGPERFGLFGYVLAFVSLFTGLAKLGLDGIVVRNILRFPENQYTYLGTAFWLKIIGAIIFFVTVTSATFLTSNTSTTNLYIFIIASGMIFQSFEVVDFYFQSKVLSKFVSKCKIFQLSISSGLKLYLVLTGADLFWFFILALVDQATLGLSMLYIYFSKKNESFFKKFEIQLAKQMLKDSWPVIISGFAIALYMRIDQIMIKEMLGDREVGIYIAAVKLSEVSYFIPMIISASIFPAIANAKNISRSLYENRLQSLYILMFWLAVIVAIPISFFSEFLIGLIYGNGYVEAARVLTIHAWAGIFVYLGVASSSWFLNENLLKYSTINTLIGAIVNIVLNLILIPLFGISGAAIATLLSYSIAAYFMNGFFKVTRDNFFRLTKVILLSKFSLYNS